MSVDNRERRDQPRISRHEITPRWSARELPDNGGTLIDDATSGCDDRQKDSRFCRGAK
jgi:hypothetical protein